MDAVLAWAAVIAPLLIVLVLAAVAVPGLRCLRQLCAAIESMAAGSHFLGQAVEQSVKATDKLTRAVGELDGKVVHLSGRAGGDTPGDRQLRGGAR